MWRPAVAICLVVWGQLGVPGDARSAPQLPAPASVMVADESDPHLHHDNSAPAEGAQQEAAPLYLLPDSPHNYDYQYGHPDYHYDTPEGRPAVVDAPRSSEEEEEEEREGEEVEEEEENPEIQGVEEEEEEPESGEVEDEAQEVEEEGEAERGSVEEVEGELVEEVKEPSTSNRIFSWLESTWSQMVNGVEGLVAGVEEMRKGLVAVVERMGEQVERGAEYVRNRLQDTANYVDSKSREVLRVLEAAVRRGDQRVVDLLRLIGEKVEEWTDQLQARVQEAEEQRSVLGSWFTYWTKWHSEEQQEQDNMPDFFEDQEVREKLEDLVQGGVLRREDLEGVGML